MEGDIATLFELTFKHNRPISEANIRAAATILRRWLVDGDLKKFGQMLTEPIMFPALDSSTVVRQTEATGMVDYFLTGGVMMNGVPVQGICHSPHEPSANDVLPLLPLPMILLKEQHFVRQRRLYHRGTWFTLEQIIRYVANKLGGSHFDTERPGVYGKLDEASKFMRYGGPIDSELSSELLLVLEPESQEIIDGVHIEIIAAAASFIQMHLSGKPLVQLEVNRPRWYDLSRWRKRKSNFKLVESDKR